MNETPLQNASRIVLSRDGTRIGYLSLGSGPSVLVVPGVLSMAADYTAFARALMKLLLVLLVSCSRQYRQMLGLLEQNLLEWQEIPRLDSSYEHYREIAGGVLLMYGGKSDSKAVALAWSGSQRYSRALKRRNFHSSTTSESKEPLHERLPKRLVTTF